MRFILLIAFSSIVSWTKASILHSYFQVNDTLIITKSITNEIPGSAYRKRANLYQMVNKNDTSKFSIILLESNKNEFDNDGSVHLNIRFDKTKSFKEQKAELSLLLKYASKDYRLDSLKGIFALNMLSLGDLNIQTSKELVNQKNLAEILKSHKKLNSFLLKSSLSGEFNSIFERYHLAIKNYSIEHFGFGSDIGSLNKYSKIETNKTDLPTRIMRGAMWVNLK